MYDQREIPRKQHLSIRLPDLMASLFFCYSCFHDRLFTTTHLERVDNSLNYSPTPGGILLHLPDRDTHIMVYPLWETKTVLKFCFCFRQMDILCSSGCKLGVVQQMALWDCGPAAETAVFIMRSTSRAISLQSCCYSTCSRGHIWISAI